MLSRSPIYQAIATGLAEAKYLVITVVAVTVIAAIIMATMPATAPPQPHDYATTSVLP
jgi:hypothetical protein